MNTFENYLLESYMIYSDPVDIAIEASIEDSLGNGKLARKEKRLLAAVKNDDKNSASKIKEEIDADAKKIEAAARRERNIRTAKAALSIAAKAASLASMIYGMINSNKENKKFNELLAAGKGAQASDLQYLADLKKKSGTVSTGASVIGYANDIVNMIL